MQSRYRSLKTDKADVATVFDTAGSCKPSCGDQNFTNLQLLVPGAQKLGWSHAASENPQASQQIMVNGQAFAGTAFELDGTDNQDPILGIIVINPTMDAVTETKITTQNFDAELGKAVSAVVTAQTKSGTNSFHGSVYDFRTSNANLARDPFSQAPLSYTKAHGLNPSIPSGLKNRFGGYDRRTDHPGQVLLLRKLRGTAAEGWNVDHQHGADATPDGIGFGQHGWAERHSRCGLQRVRDPTWCGGHHLQQHRRSGCTGMWFDRCGRSAISLQRGSAHASAAAGIATRS